MDTATDDSERNKPPTQQYTDGSTKFLLITYYFECTWTCACDFKIRLGSGRTQEHPDAIIPQGPRSTQTPLQHKPPPGTQEHPDAIGLEGPRSTQTPLDQEDPGVTKRYWTKRTQKYPRHHWTRRSQKHP
ncbi:hypothetical protein STEG23_012113 [Scotinomys teguina]